MSAEQQNLERYRVVLEPRKRLLFGALLLIIAFLRGTTNEPPDNWFTEIDTWEKVAIGADYPS